MAQTGGSKGLPSVPGRKARLKRSGGRPSQAFFWRVGARVGSGTPGASARGFRNHLYGRRRCFAGLVAEGGSHRDGVLRLRSKYGTAMERQRADAGLGRQPRSAEAWLCRQCLGPNGAPFRN